MVDKDHNELVQQNHDLTKKTINSIYLGSMPEIQSSQVQNFIGQAKTQFQDQNQDPQALPFKSKLGLSFRGLQARTKPKSDETWVQVDKTYKDKYCSRTNPGGYFPMFIADNEFMKQEIHNKVLQINRDCEWPMWVYNYGPVAQGHLDVRTAVANYMQKYWVQRPVDPDHIAMINGCAPACEFMMQILCEEYDTVIVPTPLFTMFFTEWWVRTRVAIVGAKTKAEDNFDITDECLEAAYVESVKNGKVPKVLLLIQPNNPTGKLYSKETILRCINWAKGKGIHVISDEIYAITIFEDSEMLSMARVVHDEIEQIKGSSEEKDKEYVHYLTNYTHIVGGFSKDFCVNGLRTGIIYSKNAEVLDAMGGFLLFVHNYMSNNSAFLLQKMLSDATWLDSFVKTTRRRLTLQFKALKTALDSIEVPTAPCNGSLMCFADFSKYLRENTWEAEQELDRELFDIVKIHLQAGQTFMSDKPGWLRFMFTAMVFHSEEEITQPFEEMGRRLKKWKEEREKKEQ